MTPVLRLIASLVWVGAILVFWLVAAVIVLSFLGWPGR